MKKWRLGHFNQDLKPHFCSDSRKGAWKIRYDFLRTGAPTPGWESNMSIFRVVTSWLVITQMFEDMKFPKTLTHCQEEVRHKALKYETYFSYQWSKFLVSFDQNFGQEGSHGLVLQLQYPATTNRIQGQVRFYAHHSCFFFTSKSR